MNFSEEFMKSSGAPLMAHGRKIVPAVRLSVLPAQVIEIEWISAIASPVQGIQVALKGGRVRLGDATGANLRLWNDTSPRQVTLICECRRESELLMWNTWRDGRGVTQAWMGNAGLTETPRDDGSTLVECNSRNAVTFADVVFVFRTRDAGSEPDCPTKGVRDPSEK